jgi:hypothetical protein
MANPKTFKTGDLILDTRKSRQLRLKGRINPQGADVKPYWTVENVETKKITTIREDRFRAARFMRVPSDDDLTSP